MREAVDDDYRAAIETFHAEEARRSAEETRAAKERSLRRLAELQLRPHVVYGAKLVSAPEGPFPGKMPGWHAVVGDLVVYGDTPERAMAGFDRAWKGGGA